MTKVNDRNSNGDESSIATKPASSAMVNPLAQLAGEQRTAMEQLLLGKSICDVATASGVARTTIYRWLKKDPNFQAVYNQWHEEMRESCRSRLLMLSDKAAGAIEKALDGGDARSALQLLKAIGLLAPTPPRPTDAEDVKREADIERKRWKTKLEIDEINLRSELAAGKVSEEVWSRPVTGG